MYAFHCMLHLLHKVFAPEIWYCFLERPKINELSSGLLNHVSKKTNFNKNFVVLAHICSMS